MDSRAAKAHGDPESESLVRNIVAVGMREGWLVRFDRTPGKSGSEMLYLVENQQTESSPNSDPQNEIIDAESFKPEPPEAIVQWIDVNQPPVATPALEAKVEEVAPPVESPKKSAKENLPERTGLMEREIQDEMIGSLAETREYFWDAIESILKDKGEGSSSQTYLKF
jgi:hypothetical protein